MTILHAPWADLVKRTPIPAAAAELLARAPGHKGRSGASISGVAHVHWAWAPTGRLAHDRDSAHGSAD